MARTLALTIEQVRVLTAILAHERVSGESEVAVPRVAAMLGLRGSVALDRARALERRGLLRTRVVQWWGRFAMAGMTDAGRRWVDG